MLPYVYGTESLTWDALGEEKKGSANWLDGRKLQASAALDVGYTGAYVRTVTVQEESSCHKMQEDVLQPCGSQHKYV